MGRFDESGQWSSTQHHVEGYRDMAPFEFQSQADVASPSATGSAVLCKMCVNPGLT